MANPSFAGQELWRKLPWRKGVLLRSRITGEGFSSGTGNETTPGEESGPFPLVGS